MRLRNIFNGPLFSQIEYYKHLFCWFYWQKTLNSSFFPTTIIHNNTALHTAQIILIFNKKTFPKMSSCSNKLLTKESHAEEVQESLQNYLFSAIHIFPIQINNKLRSTMRKGQQLLSKIENLLLEIEQPSPQKFFKKNPVKAPSTTRQEMAIVQNNQKSIQAEKNKLLERLKAAQQKENPQQTFKVRNKTSLYLLAQKPLKPIHQRVQDIQRKKSLDIERIREQNPDPQILQDEQQEAIALAMEQRRRNQKKYSLAEVSQKMKEMQNRQRQQRQKQDIQRAQHIRKESQKITNKPHIRERSKEIWHQYKEKKDLSSSVFARFEQYEVRRKEKFDKRMKELKQQFTPFAPKISTNSRLIASHLTSRRDLSQQLSRSLSCRCFQRSTQRSLSKSNLRHNRSTALQTSRQL